jgi:hypothetical protein
MLAGASPVALPSVLARAGGASYDGVVALQAAASRETLLTLDERAQDTYRRLGAAFTIIS